MPMRPPVVGSEAAVAVLDRGATLGKVRHQGVRDPGDLADHPLVVAHRVGPVDEPDSEPATHSILEPGVVPLGCGDRGGVDHPGIEREPACATVCVVVAGADLVRDRQMSVQVRVAGARVAVVERGGEEAAGLDLLLPGVPDPGERGLPLEPGKGVGDRLNGHRGSAEP